jgi:hypothetical protein
VHVVQDGLLSSKRAAKLLDGEGPYATFGGGRHSGSTLVMVSEIDPEYLNWVLGRDRANGVMKFLAQA